MVLGEGENFFIKKQNSNFSAKQFRGDKDNYAAESYCSVKKKEESARFTATFGGDGIACKTNRSLKKQNIKKVSKR